MPESGALVSALESTGEEKARAQSTLTHGSARYDVFSELRKPRPHVSVLAWLQSTAEAGIALTREQGQGAAHCGIILNTRSGAFVRRGSSTIHL